MRSHWLCSREFLESGCAAPSHHGRVLGHHGFRTEKIRDTVVFFGSARIRSREASEQQLEAAGLGERHPRVTAGRRDRRRRARSAVVALLRRCASLRTA
jgi:hypothetical protein